MSIKQFIYTEILLPRLRQADVLVVYDPDRRYRELCLELASDLRMVVDAGESSIESREAALARFKLWANPTRRWRGCWSTCQPPSR